MMSDVKRSLGLIDLISEKHMELRKKLHEASGQPVNKSEAHILAVLEANGVLSISQIGRLIGMTRQGVHKYMLGLQTAGLVAPATADGNARDRRVELTPHGRETVRLLEETKQRLEEEITRRLGKAEMERLLELLRGKWLT
ncbi:MarR family winged helix-turn-helix transcriptional regulator [Paenibacillus mesotrionivorans]|uniref:MarR family winged helix-turn-helix transcriptional regulator n=1 Tax=Paenibacillus mesotrionivorans TaxID=3160968 RepID=A0ACC7NYD0_9BACL